MSTHLRTSKLKRYVKRLEAKKAVYLNNPPKLELLNEVIAEIKHEFKLEDGDKG